jgi:hypothetical protein
MGKRGSVVLGEGSGELSRRGLLLFLFFVPVGQSGVTDLYMCP